MNAATDLHSTTEVHPARGDVAPAESTSYTGTRAAVLALLKKQPAGTHFYVTTRSDAPIVGDDGAPTDRVFSMGLHASVRVSKVQAMQLCRAMLSDVLEGRGARIPARTYVSPRATKAKPYRAFYLG